MHPLALTAAAGLIGLAGPAGAAGLERAFHAPHAALAPTANEPDQCAVARAGTKALGGGPHAL